MEPLKIGDDNETITLRFTEQVEEKVCSEIFIKREVDLIIFYIKLIFKISFY